MTNISVIPPVKTVHQIWLQGYSKMSKEYQGYSDEYSRMNDGDYMLWDETMILALIRKEYPQLLEEYEGYQFWVMRVDLARLVIMHHHGGFYVDMDTKPLKSFAPLVSDSPLFYYKIYNWLIRLFTRNQYINNNFMYFPHPKHPLADLILKRAEGSHIRNFYDFKMLYVVENTGPHFLMRCIDEYLKEGGEIKTITEEEMEEYFHDEEANTWFDIKTVFDMHDYIILAGFIVLLLLMFLSFKFSWPKKSGK